MNPKHLARRFAWAVLGFVVAVAATGSARAAVGRTEASYGVTQNGAAVYTIPIQATEGIHGMTPRLSINYVGPATRSIFGVGFALGGISYITPCRKTIAQDLNAEIFAGTIGLEAAGVITATTAATVGLPLALATAAIGGGYVLLNSYQTCQGLL